ncbi:response regulator [Candidatus Micrarchaeota archaeon]|nr:response regulator [Candidatus Micrarchaeota archaeon]
MVVLKKPKQAAERPERMEEWGEPRTEPVKKSLSILVVDDNPAMLRLLTMILDSRGHRTSTAENGRKGLEAFRKGGIDLVISDYQMPEMDGLQMLQEIRKTDPATGVIIASSRSKDELKEIFGGHGATMILEKPLEHDDILEALEFAARAFPKGI